MFCTKCGKELAEGIKFCPYCGNAISTTITNPSPSPKIPSVNPSLTLTPVLISIGAAVAVILTIVIIFLGINIYQLDNEQHSEDKIVKEDKKSDIEDSKEWTASNHTEIDIISTETAEQVVSPENPEISSEANMDEMVDETITNPSDELSEEQIILLPESTKEGILQRTIMEMNASAYSNQLIHVYENNYTVGERDTSYIWDDTIFYTLEGYQEHSDYYNKNLCTLIKKELVNQQTGNIMDYEIYMNPNSDVANKIVSIEYLTDGIEVTEYYYTKDKKVSFIFQYQCDNYVSTYATPDKKGMRFLYNNDCLVTWRDVNEEETKNYSIGKNEINRLKDKWKKNTLIEYSNMDDDKKADFDYYENLMLNAAYNTYETVLNAEGISIIQGYIFDQDSSGLDNSTVELYDVSFENKLYSTKTDSDGSYRIYVPFEEYTYNVRIAKDEFNDCKIYNVKVNNEQIGVYQDTVHMFKSDATDTSVSLTLGDAFNYNSSNTGMLLLSNADINIRQGINHRTGEDIVFCGTTDENGYIQISLKPGVYTLEVTASGYETMYYTIIANPILSNIYEFYAAPKLDESEYAIVLTWGANPSDLDSHLFTNGSSSSHIWYGGMADSNGNSLDVDDTSSYGPETITINKFSASEYYKYCVVDFSNCSYGNLDSYEMSNSQATVNVYSSNGLIGTFHVPTNTAGVIWEVFEIRNGRVTPIQRYYDNVTDKNWWHQDK